MWSDWKRICHVRCSWIALRNQKRTNDCFDPTKRIDCVHYLSLTMRKNDCVHCLSFVIYRKKRTIDCGSGKLSLVNDLTKRIDYVHWRSFVRLYSVIYWTNCAYLCWKNCSNDPTKRTSDCVRLSLIVLKKKKIDYVLLSFVIYRKKRKSDCVHWTSFVRLSL